MMQKAVEMMNRRLVRKQVVELKEVSKQTEEFLAWLKENATFPDAPGVQESFENAINHQSNIAAYFEIMEQKLNDQINDKEKKPS